MTKGRTTSHQERRSIAMHRRWGNGRGGLFSEIEWAPADGCEHAYAGTRPRVEFRLANE